MNSRVEAEGNSIDEAIESALRQLGIPREQARVEILQDSRKGLLGFGGQKARVAVSLRSALGDASGAGPTGDAAGARDVLDRLLGHMEVEASIEVSETDGETILRVATASSGLLIGRHGQTLDAIEYLVNRIAGKRDERGNRIVVDCEGYRERHQRDLQETAQRMAQRVRERGKPQTTNPMNPRDRRIIHVALGGESDVTTRSLGQGYLRRVVIAPARGPKPGPQSADP